MRLQHQAERLSEQTFLGAPAKDFERGGREQLSYLLAAGLNPHSKVVELGTSHESDVPGCIYHSLRWVRAQCSRRGLVARNLGRDRAHGQSWLEITRRARLP